MRPPAEPFIRPVSRIHCCKEASRQFRPSRLRNDNYCSIWLNRLIKTHGEPICRPRKSKADLVTTLTLNLPGLMSWFQQDGRKCIPGTVLFTGNGPERRWELAQPPTMLTQTYSMSSHPVRSLTPTLHTVSSGHTQYWNMKAIIREQPQHSAHEDLEPLPLQFPCRRTHSMRPHPHRVGHFYSLHGESSCRSHRKHSHGSGIRRWQPALSLSLSAGQRSASLPWRVPSQQQWQLAASSWDGQWRRAQCFTSSSARKGSAQSSRKHCSGLAYHWKTRYGSTPALQSRNPSKPWSKQLHSTGQVSW